LEGEEAEKVRQLHGVEGGRHREKRCGSQGD
jgi:hypothetical protein